MKIIRSWLDEYISLGDRPTTELAATFESLGHEVEAIEASQLSGVVVGKILEVSAHPNADRLQVARVDVGTTILTVVCGAPNLAAPQTVAVAPIGTHLPGGMIIEKRIIREVVSEGMICAADELGLSDDHNGILVLDDRLPVGQPFIDAHNDPLLTLAITPNRGDALSLVGLARDLGSRLEIPLTLPTVQFSSDNALEIPIKLISPEFCPRYSARLITNIQKNELPSHITQRLVRVGHGRYHPIVDITNYVMEEHGIPLHAFDADTVTLPLEIRPARDGEMITLLDNTEYTLDSGMLVIADQTGPIALAGIMGGKKTAVSDTTTSIILEAAYFDPKTVRLTRTKLKLVSDAAYRFERGTDPMAIETASDRATALILEYCSASAGPIHIVGTAPPARAIEYTSDQINRYLGTNLDDTVVVGILERLGCIPHDGRVLVPSWRSDVTIWQDLAEEVARIHGYDQITRSPLAAQPIAEHADMSEFNRIENFKDQLAQAGWTQHVGSSFLSDRDLLILNLPTENVVRVQNPVSVEAGYLRPTLQMSLLRAIAKNPIFPSLFLFEIGSVFIPQADTSIIEETRICLAGTGKNIDTMLAGFGLAPQVVQQSILDKLKIRRPVRIVEFPLADAVSHMPSIGKFLTTHPPIKFQTPSRFQATVRDISFVIEKDIDIKVILAELLTVFWVRDVEIFDEYQDASLGVNKKSVALRLLLEHPERVLTGEDIEQSLEKVREILHNRFNADIR